MGLSAAAALERCLAAGGVAVFPADTVYGLACDPESPEAVRRLYALKGRRPEKPAAIMLFAADALSPASGTGAAAGAAAPAAGLPTLGPRTRAAAAALLPGPLTLLVPNPEGRFPLAGGGAVLGLRVPDVPLLADVGVPILQTSANLAGEADARRLDDVPAAIRDGADLVIDGGALPGTPSTVVDLTRYEDEGVWRVARSGVVSRASLEAVLGGGSSASSG